MLTDIMNDHGLEQLVHFPTREKNTLDLLLTSLPGQFQDIHSLGKLSDHDIVAGTLKVFILPIKKPRERCIYILSTAIAYLCVIDAKHFLNDPHSDKNAIMSSVLIP